MIGFPAVEGEQNEIVQLLDELRSLLEKQIILYNIYIYIGKKYIYIHCIYLYICIHSMRTHAHKSLYYFFPCKNLDFLDLGDDLTHQLTYIVITIKHTHRDGIEAALRGTKQREKLKIKLLTDTHTKRKNKYYMK